MQGVNVVARPLDANGNPLYQYTVTAVTGALFSGNHGNPVTGFTDASGNLLTMWGSNDPALQGSFDLSGIPLPPGVDYRQLPDHFRSHRSALHPRKLRRPLHAGPGRALRHTQPSHFPISPPAARKPSPSPHADSPVAGFNDAIGSESQPRPMPTGGLWCGRSSQVGQTDWFTFPVRGNRIFTVVTQALDETGAPIELQGHALHRRVGRIRLRRRNARRRRARPQRPRHRRNLAARCHQRRRHRAHRHRRPARRRPPRLRLQRLAALRRHRLARASARFRRSHHHSGHGLSPRRHGSRRRPARARHQHLAQPDHRHRARRAASGVTGSVDVEVDDLPTLLRGRHHSRRHQLRLRHGRRAHSRHRALEHRSHRRAHSLHRHRARLPRSRPPAASPSSTPSPPARPRSPAVCPSVRSPPPAMAAPP